mmetsp:Transcript_35622/g.113911  ORF Transcript_35622/g.113911 Transcript_35622/m.113911 type:complete len:295 (-) Transcript_35622:2079-2963(-)
MVLVLLQRGLVLQVRPPRTQPARLRVEVQRAVDAARLVPELLEGADERRQHRLDRAHLAQSVQREARLLAALAAPKRRVGVAEVTLPRVPARQGPQHPHRHRRPPLGRVLLHLEPDRLRLHRQHVLLLPDRRRQLVLHLVVETEHVALFLVHRGRGRVGRGRVGRSVGGGGAQRLLLLRRTVSLRPLQRGRVRVVLGHEAHQLAAIRVGWRSNAPAEAHAPQALVGQLVESLEAPGQRRPVFLPRGGCRRRGGGEVRRQERRSRHRMSSRVRLTRDEFLLRRLLVLLALALSSW